MKKNNKNKLILYALTLLSVVNISGCVKKNSCNKEDRHVHLYVSDYGFMRYASDEYYKMAANYYKTDYTVDVNAYEQKYHDYISDNNFLHIETNYDLLKKYYPKLPDQIEYEYVYDELIDKKYIRNQYGEIIEEKDIFETKTNWTSDVRNKNLTGNQRVMGYGYRGYKIYFDNNKNCFYYELSDYYDTLDDLLNAGYTHVNLKTFAKRIEKNEIISFDKKLSLS